jgi:uncharacterized protein YndB with AHSA1/START domain
MPTTTIPAIERRVEFRAPPERVWRAITDETELSAWFGHRTKLDLRPGGLGWFEWEDHGRFPVRVDVLEPPHRLVWSWGEVGDLELQGHATEVEWRLEPLTTGGTRLHLRESGFVADNDRWANSEGWLTELAQLAEHVASEPWEAGIHRTYTFRSPLERVWRAFADRAEFAVWWGEIGDLRLEAGAEGWFDWPTEGRHAVRIEAVEPPRYLAWSWTIEVGTPLASAQEVLRTEWFLQDGEEGGTIVHLFESGFIGPENHRENSLGWDTDVEPVLRKHLGEAA